MTMRAIVLPLLCLSVLVVVIAESYLYRQDSGSSRILEHELIGNTWTRTGTSYNYGATVNGNLVCLAYSYTDDLLWAVVNTGAGRILININRATGFVSTAPSLDLANQYTFVRDCDLHQRTNHLVAFARDTNVNDEDTEIRVDLNNAAPQRIYITEHDELVGSGSPSNPWDGFSRGPAMAYKEDTLYVVSDDRALLLQDGSGYPAVVDRDRGRDIDYLSYEPDADRFWFASDASNTAIFRDNSPFEFISNNFDNITTSVTRFGIASSTGSFTFAPVPIPGSQLVVPHQCCPTYLISYDDTVRNMGGMTFSGVTGGTAVLHAISDTTAEVTLAMDTACIAGPRSIGFTVNEDVGAQRTEDLAVGNTFTGCAEPTVYTGLHNRVRSGDSISLNAALDHTAVSPSAANDATAWGVQFEWDLDGDAVFGEVGIGANYGDEVGSVVRLVTRGRNGDGIDNGPYNVQVRIVSPIVGTTPTRGCLCDLTEQTFTINVVNTKPTVALNEPDPLRTSGSTTSIDAVGTDFSATDQLNLEFEWDLDGDFIFGETGPAATNGDEVGASVFFTSTVGIAPSTFEIRVQAVDPQGARSSVVKAPVLVPGLAATRECQCCDTCGVDGGTSESESSALQLLDSAVFDPQDPYSVLLTQASSLVSGATTGAMFRQEKVTFNIITDIGFEVCAKFQVANLQATTMGYAAMPGDGGISFVVTAADPADGSASTGGNGGLVNRPQSTGLSVLLQDTFSSIRYGSTGGYATPAASGGYPALDAHEHHLFVRYTAATRSLETFVDGISRELRTFDLFDETILGIPGPEFEVYVGFAASTSATAAYDIRVSSDFSFCRLSDFPEL